MFKIAKLLGKPMLEATELSRKLDDSVKKSVVFLSFPGHGEETPGKRSPVWPDGSQLFEWEFNRRMDGLIRMLCDAVGIEYVQLVTEDEDIPIPLRGSTTAGDGTRIGRLKQWMKDNPGKDCVLLDLHANAADSAQAHGFELFTTRGQNNSDTVAEFIFQEFKYWAENGSRIENMKLRPDNSDGDGDKEVDFASIRKAPCKAVLIEFGFMTNEEECKLLMDEKYTFEMAAVVTLALLKYVASLAE